VNILKKAIFLVHSIDTLNYVYSNEIKNKLNSITELYPNPINRENLHEHFDVLKEAEIAFSTWGMIDFSEDEIKEYLPKLKAVFYAAGSVQGFARPYLNCGIKVASAWAANAVPVAEYTVAQIILSAKGFFQCAQITKDSYDNGVKLSKNFPGNYNIKIGLLGAGMIGKKVIELLAPYKYEILVFDPFLTDEKAFELNVKKAELSEIFKSCQVISNHLANLPETVGILNKNHFEKMLSYAVFINTGRGAQVVEADLIDALKKVPTRLAILDVTDPEPPLESSQLLNLKNVILTPHIAGSLGNEVVRMSEYMVEEFLRYENDEELKYNVTLKMLETMA
jgi:phosphoglycerate dehydrogenase-like enzyme